MCSWTPEQHAAARVWAKERGAKSRALAGALDEIERLQAENAELDLKLKRIAQTSACAAPAQSTGTYEMRCSMCPEPRCARRYEVGAI